MNERHSDIMVAIKTKIQHRAQYLANKAAKQGMLPCPNHCELCGDLPIRCLHKHHEIYQRPLDVKFLCERCHVLKRTDKKQTPEQQKKAAKRRALYHKAHFADCDIAGYLDIDPDEFETDKQRQNAKNIITNRYEHQILLEQAVFGQKII